MATHGTMKQFNPQVDDWPTYVERLQYYFVANDVDVDAKKRAILLTVCGAPTYKLLRSLVPDGKLDADDVTYDSLVKLLKDYYDPKPSLIVQRFHFNSRSRGPSESVSAYVAALRDLALKCDYGDYLQDMLRDHLVCGVNHRGIQRKLLAETGLTYESAYTLALAAEASERDAEALQRSTKSVTSVETPAATPLAVHQVSLPAPLSPAATRSSTTSTSTNEISKPPITCYHCGGLQLAPQCTRLNSICRYCKKPGHLGKQSKPSENDTTSSTTSTPQNYVSQLASELDNEYTTFPVAVANSEPYHVAMSLNGVLVSMDVDTGGALTVINQSTYERLLEQSQRTSQSCNLVPSGKLLRSYTGHPIPVLGTMPVEARYEGKGLVLPVYVVSGCGPNLLGRDWLSHF